ncbi:hypothetical protein [Tessaracoccus terricola]
MNASEVMTANAGVVRMRDHRDLRSFWWRALRAGLLVQALPGIAMDAGLVDDRYAWIRAVALWNPNAVIAGRAAGALDFDDCAPLSTISVYVNLPMADRGPIQFFRTKLDPALLEWKDGVRITGPAATAITAGLEDDLGPGTTALRKGRTTPAKISSAARSWSQRSRKRACELAHDLSGNPWSPAEVDAHRLFREAGIRGWQGNKAVVLDGTTLVPDISIEEARIAFEINSFQFHSTHRAMEEDSSRLNRFIANRWRSYTLTPRQMRDHREETKEFVRSVVWDRHRLGA